MLTHIENTLGVKEELEKTLIKLVFFREIQDEYGAVILYSCAMAERLLYEMLVEIRYRLLRSNREGRTYYRESPKGRPQRSFEAASRYVRH